MANPNIDPIYAKSGEISWNSTSALFTAAMTAGNVSSFDGTDANIKLIWTADATNGGYLDHVRARCCSLSGASAASVLRLFVNNGSTPATAANNVLFDELGLPATTNTIVAATAPQILVFKIMYPIGYRLYGGLGTAVTTGWAVSAVSGKY